MKGYFIIAMILELFLVIFAGNMVGKGHYGAETSAGLCAIILAIYTSAYIAIWKMKNKQ